ncbi:MAG: response regulator transcription factor [Candidatus Omnitrophica bacterium]|nr:response regulator transcription factor [Candidatus Omnitrophota bacterium]
MQKILIIEDDKNIAKLIRYNLEKAGYECLGAITGEEGFELLNRALVNLIILDVMLPQMDGFEVCRSLRQDERLKHIPVIMLTARGEEVDRIVGLELGADDYMVKPFSPRELALRVKAVLRRGKTAPAQKENLAVGDVTIDIEKHQVRAGEKAIDLTAMEFKLLVVMMERPGRVQTRERLLADVWDIHADVSTRTVDTHIKRLREKLGRPGKAIETVIGIGYRFKAEDDET